MAAFDAPPLSPDEPTARQWLREELSKREYQERKPLLDRVLEWLAQHLGGSSVGGTGIPWWVFAGVILLALIALGVLAWRRYAPTASRPQPSRMSGSAVFDDSPRETAAEYRTFAEEALETDPTASLMAAFRAAAVRASDEGWVNLAPATTVGDLQDELGHAQPALRSEFHRVASSFASVRYGGHIATRAQAEGALRLDDTVARLSAATTPPSQAASHQHRESKR